MNIILLEEICEYAGEGSLECAILLAICNSSESNVKPPLNTKAITALLDEDPFDVEQALIGMFQGGELGRSIDGDYRPFEYHISPELLGLLQGVSLFMGDLS